MKATLYTTDEKNGFSQKRLFYNNTKMDAICTATVSDNPINESFSGFGVAITGASCYELSTMSEEARDKFLSDIYGHDGINLSVGRLSIGSSDYSADVYSYCDKENDIELESFSIERDKEYIIPMIKEILKHNPNMKLFASPWSPPKFMKNTKMLILGGKLLNKYKQTYADYFVKYINSYKELGINIDYVTIQNETNGMPIWESCLYNSKDESDFLANYLYPTFCKNNINTKILVYDHNKEKLFNRAVAEFSNPKANEAASGIAFHWYSGNHFENIRLCREKFPDKLLFHTEGCFSYDPNNSFPNQYAHDIIEDLNAGVNGWYLSMILHKEAHSRLGFYGYDLQDQAGAANSLSVRSDEGLIHELRGPNYPNYAMNVGHQPEYAGIAQAPHAARGDAFCTNPLIKIAFADNNNTFDFKHVRKEIARGALREFMPSGERDIIIPSR